MSQGEREFRLDIAKIWADVIATDLVPLCDRVQIVGSVRRQKPLVHDLEIVIIPLVSVTEDLFGYSLVESKLEKNYDRLVKEWSAQVIQAGPKKKKLLMPEGITLELHISSQEGFAVETVIRTGPAEFSHKCVMARKWGGYLPSDCRIHNGWKVYRGSKYIPMNCESDFLDFLGLGWVDPEKRSEQLVPGVSVETRSRP